MKASVFIGVHQWFAEKEQRNLMGFWGPGNVENDGFQNYLAETCYELFERVMELLKDPRGHEYDDIEIDELFVKIEMIFAMSDRGMITAAPDREALESLVPSYLERWENYQVESVYPWPGN